MNTLKFNPQIRLESRVLPNGTLDNRAIAVIGNKRYIRCSKKSFLYGEGGLNVEFVRIDFGGVGTETYAHIENEDELIDKMFERLEEIGYPCDDNLSKPSHVVHTLMYDMDTTSRAVFFQEAKQYL